MAKKGNVPWNKGKKGLQVAWNVGVPCSEKARELNREKHLGKHTSPKTEFKKGQHPSKKTEFKKDQKPWNAELTKETDKRLKKIGENISKAKTGKPLSEAHKLSLRKPKSEVAKRNISEGMKGEKNHFYGKHHKKESNEINREKHLRENISEETLNKIKKARATQVFPLKDTKSEVIIQTFLKSLGIEFYPHKHMKILHSYQCDIFIPVQPGIPQETVIECDGDMFHYNPAYYNKEAKIFKNGLTAEQRWKLDAARTQELIEKGFIVLRLWEHEIKKMDVNKFREKLNSKALNT
jgi:hypothetical protein